MYLLCNVVFVRLSVFKRSIQLSDSVRQPHHSCLDSPPHPLVNPLLSSSPLSSSIATSLFHSGSKPTFSTNPSHLRLFFTYRTAFMTVGLDRTYQAHRFIVSFTFQFFCLFRVVDKLASRQLFYCTLNTHYRIVSFVYYQ